MKTYLTLIPLALLCALLPARAQQVDPSHREAALDLLEATDARGTFEKSLDQLLEGGFGGAGMGLMFGEIMREFVAKYMSWESIREDMAATYTDLFTEEEIRELTAFYRTPLGRKVAELTPEVAKRGMEIARERMEAHGTELQEMIMERMMEMRDQMQQEMEQPSGETSKKL